MRFQAELAELALISAAGACGPRAISLAIPSGRLALPLQARQAREAARSGQASLEQYGKPRGQLELEAASNAFDLSNKLVAAGKHDSLHMVC